MTDPADAASQTTAVSLVRGGLWTALSHVMPQLYILAVSIAAARFLGPDDFGRQSFIAFVGLSVQLLLTSGMGLAAMRSVAEALGRRNPAQARGLLQWAWRVQAVASVFGAAGLVLVGVLGGSPAAAWALIGATTAIGILHAVPTAALLGAQHFRDAAIVGLVSGTITVPATIVVLAAGGGIVGMFAVEAAVAAINLVWTIVLAQRMLNRIAPEAAPAPALRRLAARFAMWTTVSAGLSLIAWRRSEFFFLAHYSSDAQIGFYSIAFATVSALTALLERLSTVVTSAFATLRGAQAAERIRSGFSRSLRLLVIVSLPVAAGMIAVGPDLLRLIYGADYADAGPPLIVLAAAMPFNAVSVAATSLLAGLGDARTPLIVAAAAAAMNIALAFALIPAMDAVGAALANVGGQLLTSALLIVFSRKAAAGLVWGGGSLARTTIAAAACGAAAWAVLQLVGGAGGMMLAIVIGVAVFVGLAFALRILSADDGRWLEATLGDQLGGTVGLVARRATWRARGAEA
jgi:O-antigen/teichoic acid export membrane protein